MLIVGWECPMDALLNMDVSDDIIKPWLNSIDDFVALLDTKSGILYD